MTRILALAALTVGCYNPDVGSGRLRCSKALECPSGFYCAVDLTCWPQGQAPAPVVPLAPRAVAVQAGVKSATVSWVVPEGDGGSAILTYVVSASPGNVSVTVPASNVEQTAALSGLADATIYTFSVAATNAVGAGQAATVQARVPGAPGAPGQVSAAAGVRSVTVGWLLSDPDGSGVQGYVVTASPGGASTSVGGGASSATVTGLSDGTTYTMSVTAHNAVGASAVAESAPVTTPDPPSAPENLRATAGSGSIAAAWDPPASSGGATVTSYTLSASPGAASVTTDQRTATLTGLSSGTSYTLSVVATNAVGDSPAASLSPVVP